jgi:hypothetical protein
MLETVDKMVALKRREMSVGCGMLNMVEGDCEGYLNGGSNNRAS